MYESCLTDWVSFVPFTGTSECVPVVCCCYAISHCSYIFLFSHLFHDSCDGHQVNTQLCVSIVLNHH